VSKSEEHETDILLPLANPDTYCQLIDIVNRLNREDRSITLTQFISDKNDKEKAKLLLEGAEKLLPNNYTIEKTIDMEKNPARGILKAAKKSKANLLIVGWHGENVKNKEKGRILDPVLRKAPCSVLIGKSLERLPQNPRQILVPLTGVQESDILALKTAESLLNPTEGGRITILYYNQSPIRLNHINYLLNNVINQDSIILEEIASSSEKPVKTTTLQAREFDLTVSGLIEPWLFRRGNPSYSERIALESSGAMIMVRTPQPIRSRINFFT
jgi:hypothetical protein